ncbi:MFS transporter [Actinomyces provencensis]|uniref:MFS transporter n=1 Tax=Actinomyces provencensis TaxID=1720198 RepID=UPI00098F46CD|nr:MFS transporter [Actinomyces provencensis]
MIDQQMFPDFYTSLFQTQECRQQVYGTRNSAQVCNVILSTPLGWLHDQIGYQPTFLVIAGTVALAGIYAFFVLEKDDVEVLGDPFVREPTKVA